MWARVVRTWGVIVGVYFSVSLLFKGGPLFIRLDAGGFNHLLATRRRATGSQPRTRAAARPVNDRAEGRRSQVSFLHVFCNYELARLSVRQAFTSRTPDQDVRLSVILTDGRTYSFAIITNSFRSDLKRSYRQIRVRAFTSGQDPIRGRANCNVIVRRCVFCKVTIRGDHANFHHAVSRDQNHICKVRSVDAISNVLVACARLARSQRDLFLGRSVIRRRNTPPRASAKNRLAIRRDRLLSNLDRVVDNCSAEEAAASGDSVGERVTLWLHGMEISGSY